ncbi:hypothetical protein DNL40_11490 [Xylanimonas oleitrophica]|uniref:DUF2568 domain-containing protein n=1 Tax=Xylanimonas oleitrophica TaxID=2607479 RepID=A0A2W5WP11_9MICO|nr:YrdB family protein [Xylanimonas oleitrophica]PZR52503.1 hypothetical protein DNL40_11490 [Xylanimonas oleitrophica]
MSATEQPRESVHGADPDLGCALDVEHQVVRGVAMVLRFLLEIAMLVAVGWCAWATVVPHGWRWAAASLAPVVVAALWATYLSPRAPRRPSETVRVLVELVLFFGAGAWLWTLGQPVLGAALALAWLVDRAVIATSSRPREG